MPAFKVLGPLEVTTDTGAVNPGGPQQRRLLCALLEAAGRSVSVDGLTDRLWDDTDRPSGAEHAVRSYVARLRRALDDDGSTLATTPPGYTLVVGADNVDALLAEQLLNRGHQLAGDDLPAAIEVLERAVRLWRGAPYDEFAGLEWLVVETQRLRELRLSILEALFAAHLARGTGREQIGRLESALGEYPLSERLRHQLMEALARAGRSSDAARVYQEYRRYLAEETGLEPGAELRQLEADIIGGRQGRPPGSAGSPLPRPAGTVTYLCTAVEGSSHHWANDATQMNASLHQHDDVLRASIELHRGYVLRQTEGSCCAMFGDASDAAAAALDVARRLRAVRWSGPALRVRMGLHLGRADRRGADAMAARIATMVEAAGHGGQILVTEAVRLASGHEPAVDLGSYRLRDVADPIRLHQLNDGRFPPLRVVPESRSTIPVPTTSLIGQDRTVRRIRTLLVDHRLVTLAGVGGCGKTRVAIAVAERELSTRTDGAYFADLSLVGLADDVVTAVAEAVRLRLGTGDPLEQLLEYLADKQALIVLDNCEHLIDACATFAETALIHRGGWRLLVTSRQLLDIAGEQVVQIPPLGTDGSADAVELFTTRAQELDPDFGLDDSGRDTVAELCQRLDGLPLAIELAAARTLVMSPAELLARIDERFRVLTGRSRAVPQRQRTLESTLEWSFALLDDDEKATLTALGVLRGPFDLASAAAVASRSEYETLDLLQSLITKSLVMRRPAPEESLYRLLETVRAYAEAQLERSGTLAEVRDRHLQHFLDSVATITAEAEARFGEGTAWRRVDARHWVRLRANLLAAIDWAIATERYDDAGNTLAWAVHVWRELLAAQPLLDRIEIVRSHVTDGDLRDRLLLPEIHLLLAADDRRRLQSTLAQMSRSTNRIMRDAARVITAQFAVERDPQRAAQLADSLPDRWRARTLADLHMFAGDYAAALDLVVPLRHDLAMGYLLDARIAALLLMSGRPAAALELIEDQPDADSIWRPFATVTGLCHLALGARSTAEAEIVAEAELAASGRLLRSSDTALIGLAALIHDSGDQRWAAEVILNAKVPQLMADAAMARMVASRIGVLDEYVEVRQAAFEENPPPATPYLRKAVARWTTPWCLRTAPPSEHAARRPLARP